MDFLSFIRSRGVADALQWPVSIGGGERSVAAARAVRAGDEVLRVPGKLIFSADRCSALMNSLLRMSAELKRSVEDSDELLLALVLLTVIGSHHESFKVDEADDRIAGELIALQPYAAALPRLSDLCHLLSHWKPAELSLLGCREAERTAQRRRRELRRDFTLVCRAVSTTDAASAAAPWTCRALRAALSWRNYLWARFCVQSRAFVSGLDMDPLFMCAGTADMLPIAVVPLGDMFNHACQPAPAAVIAAVNGNGDEAAATSASKSDSSASTSESAGVAAAACGPVLCDSEWVSPSDNAEARAAGGFYLLRVQEDAPAGRELCISYGDRSALDCLENYGFLAPFPSNSAENVAADIRFLLAAVRMEDGPTRGGGDESCGSISDDDDDDDSASDDDSGEAGLQRTHSAGRGVAALDPASAAPSLRRSIEDSARAVLAAAAPDAISGASNAAAAAAASGPASKGKPRWFADKTSLWEQFCSPTTVELPLADNPGSDVLVLLRIICADEADVAVLRDRASSSGGFMSPDMAESPISRSNELRVLRCIRLAVLHALAGSLALPREMKRADAVLSAPAHAPGSASPAITAVGGAGASGVASGAPVSSTSQAPAVPIAALLAGGVSGSTAHMLSALRAGLADEKSIQTTLRAAGEASAGPVAALSCTPASGSESEAAMPWPDAVPVTAPPSTGEEAAAASAISGVPITPALHMQRALLASQLREAQLAVGISQMAYVQRMLRVAGEE